MKRVLVMTPALLKRCDAAVAAIDNGHALEIVRVIMMKTRPKA